MSIYDQSPSVGAYTAEPFSVAEIDAHPDRDRIWATIRRVAESATLDASLTRSGYLDLCGGGPMGSAADVIAETKIQMEFNA